MAQIKTYSRKAKLTDSQDGAYKSSQESFFDSPDDPYFFDSQTSSFQASQLSADIQPDVPKLYSKVPAGGTISGQSQSRSEVKPVVRPAETATLVTVQAKPTRLKPPSRLSRSSTQEMEPGSFNAKQLQPKRSLISANSTEGPAAKKACLKRHSGTCSSQGRSSGSKTVSDKPKSAPATTVLEVRTCWCAWLPRGMLCTETIATPWCLSLSRLRKVENTLRLWMTLCMPLTGLGRHLAETAGKTVLVHLQKSAILAVAGRPSGVPQHR